MKNYYLLLTATIFLLACSSTKNFYQLYSINTDDNTISINDEVVYEDSSSG